MAGDAGGSAHHESRRAAHVGAVNAAPRLALVGWWNVNIAMRHRSVRGTANTGAMRRRYVHMRPATTNRPLQPPRARSVTEKASGKTARDSSVVGTYRRSPWLRYHVLAYPNVPLRCCFTECAVAMRARHLSWLVRGAYSTVRREREWAGLNPGTARQPTRCVAGSTTRPRAAVLGLMVNAPHTFQGGLQL